MAEKKGDSMRTLVKFGLFPDEVGNQAYQEILKIYPEGDKGHYINFALFEDDPRVPAALGCLERYGFNPWEGFVKREPNELRIRLERVYDEEDYEGASYFVPKPCVDMGSLTERSQAGLLQLETQEVKPKADVGFVSWPFVVVSSRVKQLLEPEAFQHVLIRPTEVVGRHKERFEGQFWELTSDLTLPPLSPYCTLRNDNGQPFDRDYNKGCHYREGLYTEPELHYTASALKEAEPFDVALTHERFGIKEAVAFRRMVVSKCFYNFCVANQLKMNWVPVRVDPD